MAGTRFPELPHIFHADAATWRGDVVPLAPSGNVKRNKESVDEQLDDNTQIGSLEAIAMRRQWPSVFAHAS